MHTVSSPRPVTLWFFTCAALVFAMALIGAITRLTESGLSIVDWRPITGFLPPLDTASWLVEFSKYQTSPQYQLVNRGMSLDDFKTIYFWEWLHRSWAHIIAAGFLFPFLYFWATRQLSKKQFYQCLGMFALGGLQGLMGWVMVVSGLVDQPEVSHYRLAAHLTLALVIYSLFIGMGLNALKQRSGRANNAKLPHRGLAYTTYTLIWLTIIWGAFVAGTDAGRIYNSFPTFDGAILPVELTNLASTHMIPGAIQAVHRALAILTTVLVLFYAWRIYPIAKRPALALALAVITQLSLGIATLLSGVNIQLATLHQAGALALLGVCVYLHHHFKTKE